MPRFTGIDFTKQSSPTVAMNGRAKNSLNGLDIACTSSGGECDMGSSLYEVRQLSCCIRTSRIGENL